MSETKIKDWEGFIAIEDHFRGAEKIYRGQADTSWFLRPTLTRILQEHNICREKAIGIEAKLLECFQKNTDAFISRLEPSNKILWWTAMQHYGAPTRLLDWSASIRIALYFAVDSHFNKDGALFLFDDGNLNFIRHNRPDATWANIDDQLEKSIAGQDYETSLYAFTNELPIERKMNQEGCFTISTELTDDVESTHDALADKRAFERIIGDEGSSLIIKYEIPKESKRPLLAALIKCGIDGNFIYPDLDGMGKKTTDLLNTIVQDIGN